ncbi:hypothetical protein HVM04_004764, partial [Escherichia coli]|nr:hypothetical protein [Escherichia coli]
TMQSYVVEVLLMLKPGVMTTKQEKHLSKHIVMSGVMNESPQEWGANEK